MISTVDAHWEVRQTLRAKGFSPDIHDAERYLGRIEVGHQSITVALEVRDLTFCSLPRIHILDRKEIGWDILAHTQNDFGICYGLDGHYSLDPAHPGAAILRVLEDAQKTLLQSSKGRGFDEIAQEYAAYWGGIDYPVYSPLPWSEYLYAFERQSAHSGPNYMLASHHASVPTGYRRLGYYFKVIELPVEARPAGGVLVPKTLAELITWITALGASKGITEAIIESAAQQKGLLVAARNGNYGAFFELPKTLTQIKSPRLSFLIEQTAKSMDAISLTHISGAHIDLESTVNRSLPRDTKTLADLSVCLVGCGAIGGHLSRLLAQLGAGSRKAFTIIDPDTLKPGNVGRHALGFSYLEQPKAEAMAQELKRFHPDISVTGLPGNAENNKQPIMRHDIVVDATGVENISCMLNKWRLERELGQTAPVIFHSFLFGHGIAAQSFANHKGGLACFRCLRPDRNDDWRFDPRRSDARDDNPVNTGCGDGAFLPYGPYASTAAASLTAQHIHEWVQGVRRHQLRTLVIDLERGKHIKPTTPPRAQSCPACG